MTKQFAEEKTIPFHLLKAYQVYVEGLGIVCNTDSYLEATGNVDHFKTHDFIPKDGRKGHKAPGYVSLIEN